VGIGYLPLKMALLFLLNGKEPMLAAAEAAASLHPSDWWAKVPPVLENTAFFPTARRAPSRRLASGRRAGARTASDA